MHPVRRRAGLRRGVSDRGDHVRGDGDGRLARRVRAGADGPRARGGAVMAVRAAGRPTAEASLWWRWPYEPQAVRRPRRLYDGPGCAREAVTMGARHVIIGRGTAGMDAIRAIP